MLKELRTQHRTVIQMVFSGYKNNEIAERLEMSACTVSQIVRSPLGQAYLEGLQDKAQEATLDVRKKLVSMNKSALDVLSRIMNPAEKAPHSVQLTAAKDVLDRTGYKAPDRLHVDMTMQTKTDQEIDAEINAMQQSIAKTTGRQVKTCLASTVAFKNEHPDQALETVQDFEYLDDEEMDSSDQQFTDHDDTIDLCTDAFSCDDALNESYTSPVDQSEESISLLSKTLLDKIPKDIFQN
jgi:predicted transcriptional regulator